jgi:integrase
MKGSVLYHAPARRYYIQWYPVKIYRHPVIREPFWAKKSADRVLEKMRFEEDAGTLILKSYMPDSPLTISVVSGDWLKAFCGTEATRKFYRKMIGDAIKYFGGDFDIRSLTYSRLQIYYNELPFTVRGKYHRLSTLKAMLHFAQKDGMIARIPPFPALPQGLKQEIRYLTREQQEKVLQAIPERHRGIFEFAMEFGLRIGEVCALQWSDITDTEIVIRRTMSDGKVRESTKTGKSRVYGRTRKADSIIRAAKDSAENDEAISLYVFRRKEVRPYTWKSLTCWWRTATKKAGIHINLYNGIRHSLGCQLMDEGIELEMVRDILGHTSTNMTRRYCQRAIPIMTKILEWRGKQPMKEAKGARN